MASNYLVSVADGNWNSSTTWNKNSNTPTLHATLNITPSTVGVNSATFTAPNITGAQSTGCLIWCNAKSGSGNWTATLQESGVNVAGATATISNANLVGSNFMYFQWTTPYAYAVATAGAYRIQLKVSSSSSGSCAADSGGSNFFFIETNDIATTPALGMNCWILPANQTGTRTITVDGTGGACGNSDTVQATLPAQRSITEAIHIDGLTNGGSEALLKWDTAASSTLTVRGNIAINLGGEEQRGTIASPYPLANIATLVWDENGTTATAGRRIFNGGKLTLQGAPKPDTTNWKTTYVSGSGTSADPLLTSGLTAPWVVGDEIVITNVTYNTTEYRFVIAVNSNNSYVLSTTKGGAEVAFTNAHQSTDEILNIERNVVDKSNVTTLGNYSYNASTTVGNVQVKWFRVESPGTTISSKAGWYIAATTGATAQVDYLVAYLPLYRAIHATSSKATYTCTGLVAVKNNPSMASGVGAIYINSGNNKTYTDCYAIDIKNYGYEINTTAAFTMTRCKAISCNTSNNSSAGWNLNNLTNCNFVSCEAQACRGAGLILAGNVTTSTFTNCDFGSKGSNTIDILCASDFYHDFTFDSCTFGSATLISSYLLLSGGSKIRFHRYQNTDNQHYWYTDVGSAQATGSGLADTNVRTVGSLAARLSPEDNATGFEWDFQIPVNAHNVATFFGYFGANAALATDVSASARIELWLPGAASASATTSIPLTDVITTPGTIWPAVQISSQYTGDISGLATVKIFVLTATPGAYLYADDFYNAGDTMTSKDPATGLDIWYNALPLTIMTPLQITPGYMAASILDANVSDHTLSGSFGKVLGKVLTVAKFIGLK